jgi:DNA-binding GntR family transcriptional regulator
MKDSRGSPERFQTAADIAYDAICKRILKGELAAGTKLTRRKMAEITGVSVIPVIEALHRLETEGLVESMPYWGSRVISLSRETIRDRFALREAVECQVARILAKHLTREQEKQLVEIAAELDNTSRDPKVEDVYWDKHYGFHLLMGEFTGCKSLIEALHRMNLFILLQRALDTRRRKPRKIAKDLHMQVVKGILSKDPDVAEQAMRTHIFDSGLIKADEI